jgi:hypothetical protein
LRRRARLRLESPVQRLGSTELLRLVPCDKDLRVLRVGQQGELGHVLARPEREPRQKAGEVPCHALDRHAVEKVGVVLERERQSVAQLRCGEHQVELHPLLRQRPRCEQQPTEVEAVTGPS